MESNNKYIDEKYLLNQDLKYKNQNLSILKNVKSELAKNLTLELNQKNIVNAINISCELLLSGYYDFLINKLVTFYFNEINLAQPIVINKIYDINLYYNNRYNYLHKKNSPHDIINDIQIRNFICFFVSICCLSSHRRLPKLINLKDDDFNLKKKKNTLISKDLNLLSKYVKVNDDKDIIIPLSEIIHLLRDKSILDREHKIIYWISWLFECEKRFHNKKINVEYRSINGLDTKYCNDFIWIVWDMLIDNVEQDFKNLIIDLYRLFKIKYTRSTKKNKSYLIITSVLLCVNPIPKIQNPIEISDETLNRCNMESIKSNYHCNEIIAKSKFIT